MNKTTKILLTAFVLTFVASAIILTIGALAKLQHWPWAGTALISGSLMQITSFVIGGITGISYIWFRKSSKA
jgi:hypothetical protein